MDFRKAERAPVSQLTKSISSNELCFGGPPTTLARPKSMIGWVIAFMTANDLVFM